MMINPINGYDMAMMRHQELLKEADERRLAKQVQRTNRVHAAFGTLLMAMGKALTRVAERPAVPGSRPGEIV